MSSGIRHRTSRRWYSKAGGETPFETLAKDFGTDEQAEDFRATLGEFKDAWKVEALGVVRDGEGTVIQRATAWNTVEAAQAHLNAGAERYLAGAVETLTTARTLYFASKGPNAHTETWQHVAVAQAGLNKAARDVPELATLVANLDGAVDEYVRIGGSDQRKPGIGGLT